MKYVQVIFLIFFGLSETATFGQGRNFNCTKDLQEDVWLSKSFENFKFFIEEEKINVNNNSFWLIGGGEGETSTKSSVLIKPMKQETLIYQYSPLVILDKQIVKTKISIDYLSNFFKKLNDNVSSNIAANAKYFVLKFSDKKRVKCVRVFYSVEFPPRKSRDSHLIDFNKLIKLLNR
ncbi:hypothetical protein GCM10011416_24040 [Polaribacter pacificus]|uniref:Uncharacterized protein n=1 Tax=Polaribacter pacificus TaxID=1775173 RepID=A0A917MFH4_9FLAO|nr:hypothetical protein [Polaribacter pacificus]GGH04129.1 hypothetical protein GCM10011416_24040 [Polaribacter pacificus]